VDSTSNFSGGNASGSSAAFFTFTPSREEFRNLARQGNLIPVSRDILADMETPVSAFLRLKNRPNAFLLESVEGGERMARYSFLGADPYLVFRSKGCTATITENGGTQTITLEAGRDPLHILETILGEVRYVEIPGLPRFVGGAVGYIGYDWVRFLEPIGETATDDLDVDDVHLLLTDTLCIFDHVRHRIRVLANARMAPGADPDAAYDAAIAKVNALIETLQAPRPLSPVGEQQSSDAPQYDHRFESNLSQTDYKKMVLAGKE